MPSIASYYAGVGVDFDISSLRKAQSYMKRIEKMMDGFKRRLEKTTNINVRIKFDRSSILKSLNTDLRRLSKSVVVPITRFQININSLNRAISTSLNSSRGQLRLNAILSANSIAAIRQQLQQSLSTITISPRVNTRNIRNTVTSSGGGGAGGRSGLVSGNYNAMRAGGIAGSIMRYGAYAIPFVGGAYGLNAMGNIAQELQSNRILLSGVAQGTTSGRTGDDYYGFLSNLSDRLGLTTRTITPQFTQMLAAARGTSLEGNLESGFTTFMEYAAGMNLSEEKIRRSLYAITQMIGKGKMGAEEVRQQLGDVLPTFLPILARAVTGGATETHIAKLDEMMKKGQVFTSKYLPLAFQEMAKDARLLLPGYFNTIAYARGSASRQQEQWLLDFMAAGGESAVQGFWSTFSSAMGSSKFLAPALGKGVGIASNALQAAMLVGPEFFDYIRGTDEKGNLFSSLFGDSKSNEYLTLVKELTIALKDLALTIFERLKPAFGWLAEFTLNTLPSISNIIKSVLSGVKDSVVAWTNLLNGNISGENIGNAFGFRQLNNLMTYPQRTMGGAVWDWFKNNTTPSGVGAAMTLPGNTDAANNMLAGKGLLDKIGGGVNVINHNNITVDSTQTAQQLGDVLKKQAEEAYNLQFSQQLSNFPKIAQ